MLLGQPAAYEQSGGVALLSQTRERELLQIVP